MSFLCRRQPFHLRSYISCSCQLKSQMCCCSHMSYLTMRLNIPKPC